ncbi:MAG TPA: non-homologous end-joining DNA ligase [Bacillales bacterium]|nr:non-homologous end-joining DNA ligase [Bacillales bacterium]
MEPIIPFEPVRSEKVPGGDYIHQVKWDGVRILTYAASGQVRLFNRKKRERTMQYPELLETRKYCVAESVILDGEVIALNEGGTPEFQQVMRRDGLRSRERVDFVRKSIPIFYMIFDVLYLNGKWLNKEPFTERMEILSKILTPNETVQQVTSHEDGETLFRVIEEKGMEGIVSKKATSPYLIGGKSDKWIKVKNYLDEICVIGGYTVNDAGTANAVLLGLYNGANDLIYVGHCGTGKMSAADWRELADRFEPLKIAESPFVNKVQRVKNIRWVRPEKTSKIRFAQWTPEGSMRQPSIQAFVDVPARECILPHNG